VKEVSICRNPVLLSRGHHPEPPIPEPILEKWQDIVNLMAEMLDVPAGLIMRILGEDIEAFVTSSTERNPYHRGDSGHFWGSGLYCETVVTKNHELLVPNALFDEAWRNNPDVKGQHDILFGISHSLARRKAFRDYLRSRLQNEFIF
jgi:hypothetical protein